MPVFCRRCALQLVLACLFLAGANAATRAADRAPVTVPITLHGVYIYVRARIDNKPVTLVLDSGAGANVLTPEAAKRLRLAPGKEPTDVTGAAGSAAPASFVSLGKLQIGNASLEGQSAAVIPLPDALSCDGLLGAGLLQRMVVSIDYERSTLTLTMPGDFHPPADAEPFHLRLHGNTPHIRATADGCKGWFQVDTGAGDALTLFRPFVEKNGLRGRYTPSIRTVTGRGVGGLLYGDVVRLPELRIGEFHILLPTTDLSRQTTGVFASGEIAGNIGGEILRRFTVTFDCRRQVMYLAANSSFGSPFSFSRSGVAVDFTRGEFVVISVLPESPGAEAGVHANDVVLAIDNRPTASMHPWEPRELLRRAPGTRIRLRLRSSDGAVHEATLVLREML